jgi:trimeric autotransporter adhesin
LQVQLSSNNPNVASVPASVTVPAGQRTASFRVDTRVVASQTQVMITARLGNSSRQATLTVNPPALESLTLDPNTVVGGNPSTGTVALNGPAPAGGLQVQLSSNNPNVASVPPSVTIPAGQRSATFTVNTQAVASQTQVTITATLNGRSRSATLTVNPRPVVIERVEVFAPNPVIDDDGQQFPVAGRRVNVRITLREPAPYRAEVRLRSSHPSVLPTPDRVYFEVGQRTLEMSIDTQRVHQNTTVTVTASNNFSEQSGRIRLYKTVIRNVVFNPNPVRAGNEFTVTITMSEHIPSGGYYITISNGNPNVIEIRPDVRAREGRQPPISDFDARARRGVRQETRVTITFRGENGEVFRRTITVRP